MRIVFVRHGDPDYARDCLTEAGKQRADINGDGALTPTDYLLLKRMILGL